MRSMVKITLLLLAALMFSACAARHHSSDPHSSTSSIEVYGVVDVGVGHSKIH